MEGRRSRNRAIAVGVALVLAVPVMVAQTCIPGATTATGGAALTAGIVGSDTGLTTAVAVSVELQGTATGGSGTYTFSWSPPGLLASANTSRAIFTPTAAGSFSFTLTVTDSAGAVETATVEVTVTEGGVTQPLAVDAGADKTAPIGGSVKLEGSSTGGGGQVSYAWTPATGLSNAAIAQPTFTPDAAGQHVFTLTATDEAGTQETDTMTVTVSSQTVLTSLVWGPDFAGGGYQVIATFSHSLHQSSAQTLSNYAVAGTGPNAASAAASGSQVTLTFAVPLSSASRLDIGKTGGLLDANANPVQVATNQAVTASSSDAAWPTVATGGAHWGADYAGSYQVLVEFSEAMDKASAETLSAYLMGGITAASAVLGADGRTVTLVFDGVALSTTSPINISVANAIEDINGKPMTEVQRTVQVNALDVEPPGIVGVTTEPTGYEVEVEFNEAMSRAEAVEVTRYQVLASGANPLSAELDVDGRTAKLQFDPPVASGDKLLISIGSTIKDINGNAVPYSIRAIQGGSGNITNPDVPILTWLPGSTSNGYQLTALFNKTMNKASVENVNHWRITGTTTSDGKPTAVTLATDLKTATVTFGSAAGGMAMGRGDRVDVSVGNTIRDTAGNALVQASAAVRANTADITSPTVTARQWVANQTLYTLRVTFSETMDKTTATTPENYSMAANGGAQTVYPTLVTVDTTGRIVDLTFTTTVAGIGTGDALTVSNSVRDINGWATTSTGAVAVGPNADGTAPAVSSVTWASNQAPYRVLVQYNEVMDSATAAATTSYTLDGVLPSAVALDAGGMQALVSFANNTHDPADLFAVLAGQVKDVTGQVLAAPPAAAAPADNTTDILTPSFATLISAIWEVDTNAFMLTATFSEALDALSVDATRFTMQDNGGADVAASSVTLLNGGSVVELTFQSSAGFTRTAPLSAIFDNAAGMRDLNGNPTVADGTVTRTIALSTNTSDITPPTAVSVTPSGTTLIVTVSESLDVISATTLLHYQRLVDDGFGSFVVAEPAASNAAFNDNTGTQVAVQFSALVSGDMVRMSRADTIRDLNGNFMEQVDLVVP